MIMKKNSPKPKLTDLEENETFIRHMTFYCQVDTLNGNIELNFKANFPTLDDRKFLQFGVQNYFINLNTLKISEDKSNSYEMMTESRTYFKYSNFDKDSIYFSGDRKFTLVKPSYFSGTQCVFLRDYIACTARMTRIEDDNVQRMNIEFGSNYLMLWRKPVWSPSSPTTLVYV